LKATRSDRFRTNFDRREEYLGPEFAAADWILGAYLNGDMRAAPRPLAEAELDRLDRRDTFRLLFGLPVAKVRLERIAYIATILQSPRLPQRLVQSRIVAAASDAERLITGLAPHLASALAEKAHRHEQRMEVLSRYGLPLPSETYGDRADLWVAWGVATWVEEERSVRVRFRTPLDAQLLSRRIRERDQFICVWCGGHGTTNDHLLVRSHGGLDTMLNGVCSCSACNQRRGDTGLRRWIRALPNRRPNRMVDALCRRPRSRWYPGRRLGESVRLPRYGKVFFA
jgi:hypothetical protein